MDARDRIAGRGAELVYFDPNGRQWMIDRETGQVEDVPSLYGSHYWEDLDCKGTEYIDFVIPPEVGAPFHLASETEYRVRDARAAIASILVRSTAGGSGSPGCRNQAPYVFRGIAMTGIPIVPLDRPVLSFTPPLRRVSN